MSLITRCPACGTMFRVVPDQLRISEGWVRCGHCSEVFDATAHLQQLPPPGTGEPAPSLAPSAQEPAPQPSDEPVAAASFLKAPDDTARAADEAPLIIAAPDDTVAQPALARATVDAQAPAPSADPVIDAPGESAAHAAGPTESADAPAQGLQRSANQVDAPVGDALDGVSFVRAAQRKAYWRRPLVRSLLAAACAVLVLVLLLQAVLHERDRLAAIEPRSRPVLEALCRPLQCRVVPLRQIDSIVIESSSFNKVRGDNYRLGLALRNKAAVPLAMPGIELTLTDAQDRPVLRRVLSATDLGAASVLGAGSEWTATLPVGLTTDGLPARITGYRLLAFYP